MATTTTTPPARTGHPTGSQRFGYVVAMACNAAGLYIAHHLLDWGWPRFLTEQFDDVLPLITVSLVYSMVTNALFLLYDARPFKSLVSVGGSVIAFVVTLRLYQVYPFDFSDYAVDWSWLATTLLVLGMIVMPIAAVSESVRAVRSLRGRAGSGRGPADEPDRSEGSAA
jgi:hypothetical protein